MPTASDWDTLALYSPGPNARFAGFIGPKPELRPLIKQVDYVALQQLVAVEGDVETVEETRCVPAIMQTSGELQILTLDTPANDDGFTFACVGPDEAMCALELGAMTSVLRSIGGAPAAPAAPTTTASPEAPSDAT